MTSNSPSERRDEFIKKIRSHQNVRGVEKVDRNLWTIHTEAGNKTVYLHYFKWYKKEAGPPGYFQASWNKTENAPRPLYHVFLGPPEDSVRVVPNSDLMGDRFTLIPDHSDGKEWRLNVNTDRNSGLLDEYNDLSILTE